MDVKELNLKVAEAQQDDVEKGIVRIDSGLMQKVDVENAKNLVKVGYFLMQEDK